MPWGGGGGSRGGNSSYCYRGGGRCGGIGAREGGGRPGPSVRERGEQLFLEVGGVVWHPQSRNGDAARGAEYSVLHGTGKLCDVTQRQVIGGVGSGWRGEVAWGARA